MPRKKASTSTSLSADAPVVRVRRLHRRDLNRTWEFVKLVFREVNRRTVEYQRPRSKERFLETYENEGIEQLLFVMDDQGKERIVGYAECAFAISGSDNWLNERYFRRHEMRPLFVEELAVHPDIQGWGLGTFVLEQLEHLAKLRGCTHLVLEVAENNRQALTFYKSREFHKLDAAVFMAKKISTDAELLPARELKPATPSESVPSLTSPERSPRRRASRKPVGDDAEASAGARDDGDVSPAAPQPEQTD